MAEEDLVVYSVFVRKEVAIFVGIAAETGLLGFVEHLSPIDTDGRGHNHVVAESKLTGGVLRGGVHCRSNCPCDALEDKVHLFIVVFVMKVGTTEHVADGEVHLLHESVGLRVLDGGRRR